jgi:hypothetical protein
MMQVESVPWLSCLSALGSDETASKTGSGHIMGGPLKNLNPLQRR